MIKFLTKAKWNEEMGEIGKMRYAEYKSLGEVVSEEAERLR
jgi:hypothetical protein